MAYLSFDVLFLLNLFDTRPEQISTNFLYFHFIHLVILRKKGIYIFIICSRFHGNKGEILISPHKIQPQSFIMFH